MQDRAISRDDNAVPAVPPRATCAPNIAALSASPAAAAAAPGRPFNVVVGRVRRCEIQSGITVPAVAAVAAIGSPAQAANPRLANDQRTGDGMVGHAEADQGQAKAKLERDTARFGDSLCV